MECIIRKASKNDIHAILDLLYYLGRPKPDNNVDQFSQMVLDCIISADSDILVATRGDILLGMVSIMYLRRLNHTKTELYIPELVVSEKYQKQGIGGKLICACIELAKDKCYRIRLESGMNRKQSHEFYTHVGFTKHAVSFELHL